MARPKKPTDELKDQRVPIMMSEDELKSIDDWRFGNRLPSRGEAIRRLCQIGMLVDNELDPIADLAVDTMNFMGNETGAARSEFRTLINENTADALFTQQELNEALSAGMHRYFEALEYVESLTEQVITLYNAILPITEADTVKRGLEHSKSVIEKANEIFAMTAERRKQSEDNRYLSISVIHESPEGKAAYEALADEEKDKYIEDAIERLREEEARDPVAFDEKYGYKPFWEREGWLEVVKARGKVKG